METYDNRSGEERRDQGMASVLDHNSEWSVRASEYGITWFEHLPDGHYFSSLDFKREARNRFGDPLSHNAWGGVWNGIIRPLLRFGRAVRCGTVKSEDPEAHVRKVARYRKCIDAAYGLDAADDLAVGLEDEVQRLRVRVKNLDHLLNQAFAFIHEIDVPSGFMASPSLRNALENWRKRRGL